MRRVQMSFEQKNAKTAKEPALFPSFPSVHSVSPPPRSGTSRIIAPQSTGCGPQYHAGNSGDAPVSESGKGRTTESPGPVRTFIGWLAFQWRWHRHYRPLLRRPIPATPEISEELRRKLFKLQRTIQ